MSKWTPGPWIAHHNFPEYIVPVEDADKKIGATANKWERREFARIVHHGYPGVKDNAANARLIAEAPAMAELLIDFVKRGDWQFGESGWPAHFQPALSKARALLARLEAE